MKRIAALVTIALGLLALVAAPRAQEQITLTTPVAPPAITGHSLRRLTVDFSQNTILVEWTTSNGVQQSKWYDATTTPTGAGLLHALNIGNFSVNSLAKAIYNRLVADGAIPPGTVVGTPQ